MSWDLVCCGMCGCMHGWMYGCMYGCMCGCKYDKPVETLQGNMASAGNLVQPWSSRTLGHTLNVDHSLGLVKFLHCFRVKSVVWYKALRWTGEFNWLWRFRLCFKHSQHCFYVYWIIWLFFPGTWDWCLDCSILNEICPCWRLLV